MSRSDKGGTTRDSRFKAFRDGMGAYRSGSTIGALPYVGQSDSENVLRRCWIDGYQRARRARALANSLAPAGS